MTKLKRPMPADELLKEIIELTAWSSYRIAKILDVPSQYVYGWLNGVDIRYSNYALLTELYWRVKGIANKQEREE